MEPRHRGRLRQRRQLETSSTLVFRVLASLGLGDIAIRLRIEQVWSEAVGRSVAAHLRPIAYARGKLTLASESSTWQQQMHFLRASIMANVNGKLPKPYVSSIHLVVRTHRTDAPAAISAPGQKNLPAAPPIGKEQHEAASQCAEAIEDEETRALFARAMAKHLARTNAP